MLSPKASEAALLYSADFSTPGQGFVHWNQSRPADSGSVTGGSVGKVEGRWTASYATQPATDNTPNSFMTTVGGLMSIVDFGGPGRLESFAIDVSSENLADLAGLNVVTGLGADERDEYFRFFYRFDGGPEVFTDSSGGGKYSVASLDVSSARSMTVGFVFDINSRNAKKGFDDGWEVSSLSVSTSAVPEPGTVFLLAVMFGCIVLVPLIRARRASLA